MGFGIGSLFEAIADKLDAPEWVGDTLAVLGDEAVIAGALVIGQPELALAALGDVVEDIGDLANVEEGPGGPGGTKAARGTFATYVGQGYPAPSDTAGWKVFLETHDFQEFRKAMKEKRVDKSVFSDPDFAETYRTKGDEDASYWQALSAVDQSNNRAISSILRG